MSWAAMAATSPEDMESYRREVQEWINADLD